MSNFVILVTKDQKVIFDFLFDGIRILEEILLRIELEKNYYNNFIIFITARNEILLPFWKKIEVEIELREVRDWKDDDREQVDSDDDDDRGNWGTVNRQNLK